MNEQMTVDYPALGKIYTVLFKNIKEIYEDSVGLIQVLRSINDEKKLKEQLINKELEIEDLQDKMNQVSLLIIPYFKNKMYSFIGLFCMVDIDNRSS